MKDETIRRGGAREGRKTNNIQGAKHDSHPVHANSERILSFKADTSSVVAGYTRRENQPKHQKDITNTWLVLRYDGV